MLLPPPPSQSQLRPWCVCACSQSAGGGARDVPGARRHRESEGGRRGRAGARPSAADAARMGLSLPVFLLVLLQVVRCTPSWPCTPSPTGPTLLLCSPSSPSSPSSCAGLHNGGSARCTLRTRPPRRLKRPDIGCGACPRRDSGCLEGGGGGGGCPGHATAAVGGEPDGGSPVAGPRAAAHAASHPCQGLCGGGRKRGGAVATSPKRRHHPVKVRSPWCTCHSQPFLHPHRATKCTLLAASHLRIVHSLGGTFDCAFSHLPHLSINIIIIHVVCQHRRSTRIVLTGFFAQVPALAEGQGQRVGGLKVGT